MQQIIMAIIDGTGAPSDQDYRLDMRHSFCVQIAEGLGLHVNGPSARSLRTYYQRGPSLEGMSTRSRGVEAYNFLASAHRFHPSAWLMLAGYSRGGSSAVYAATALDNDQIPVKAMFLFDPVAKQVLPGGELVPANVEHHWVAGRKIDPVLAARYDGTFTKMGKAIGANSAVGITMPVSQMLIAQAARASGRWFNPMRLGFEKTATHYVGRPGSRTEVDDFCGSHGALGGVGWKDVDEDAACQLRVANWMNEAFVAAKLPVRLKSYPSEQNYQ